jgi:nitronate monooxygenase
MTNSIKTPLTEMFDIRYPIIGAPMFLVSYEALTIAVAEAGGLGTFPLPNYRTNEDLKGAFKRIRQATSKPIGVNLHLSGKFEWKEQLAICLDAGVEFFITSLGDPRLIVDDVHASGGKVFPDVVSIKHAIKARDGGVDGIVAVGSGAGGHGGYIPIPVLVPYLIEKTGLPIIAAGGISTGAQMASAIALGACGIITGTRLVATPEANVVQAYKEAVVSSEPEDIVFTDRISGNNANWIKQSIERVEAAPELGSKKWLDFWSAGQSVAQIEDIKPAGEIIQEMVKEYFETCAKLQTTIA